MRRAFAGVDVVYHLAALISIAGDPDGRVRATNVDGVRNVATAALEAGVRRFVHCSSVHAFDLERPGVITETSARAVDPHLPAYDRSKAAGEVELRKVVDQGLDAVITNPSGVLGPNDFAPSRMGAVFLALARRRLPALVAGGFDWVDARDVATGMMAAEAKGRTGENYLLGRSPTLDRRPGHARRAVHRRPVAARVGADVAGPRRPHPAGLWWSRWRGTQPLFTPESLHALLTDPTVSSAKAARELGHEPRATEDTVRDVYAWFRETGILPV